MNINQICERFTLLTGISEDELSKWMPLIYDAEKYVKSILKDDVDEQRHNVVLSSAVGTYAYYKWCMYCNGNNSSSFKAGDLTISEDNSYVSLERAENLWKECKKEMAPLTVCDSFFFKGVVV